MMVWQNFEIFVEGRTIDFYTNLDYILPWGQPDDPSPTQSNSPKMQQLSPS